MGSRWNSDCHLYLLFQCDSVGRCRFQDYRGLCESKHDHHSVTNTIDCVIGYLVCYLAYLSSFYLFGRWARVPRKLPLHHWDQVGLEDKGRPRIPLFRLVVDQRIYYRLCLVYNWRFYVYLVLRVQHWYQGKRDNQKSGLVVSPIPLGLCRIRLLSYRYLLSYPYRFRILSQEDGYTQCGSPMGQGSFVYDGLLALDSRKMCQVHDKECLYSGRSDE